MLQRNDGKWNSFNYSDKLEVTSSSGRENYYVILHLKVSVLHAFRGEMGLLCVVDKKNYAPNTSQWRERERGVGEGERGKKRRIARLMRGWERGKTERRSGWVGGYGAAATWLQAAKAGEKVWIHGILDVLTWPVEGVRMDWSPRTNWESKNRERWGDGGVEKKKGVRRISMARQRHIWISLPSLRA